MAIQSKTTLKSYFNTGDRPTETQFGDLIDSSLNAIDDKSSTAEVQAGTNNTKFVTPAGAKASVLKFAPNAGEGNRGQIQIATMTEVQTGTDLLKAVSPAGAKKAVETFAPVKTVNGIAPVAGNVNLETNTNQGTLRVGIKKYYGTGGNANDIFHIKLPFSTLIANNTYMYYFKAEGYSYGISDIIDIVWVGYCYPPGVTKLLNSKSSVLRSTAITAGQYIGSDGLIHLWFKVPTNSYTTFRLDTMRVGNGPLINGDNITITVSQNATL